MNRTLIIIGFSLYLLTKNVFGEVVISLDSTNISPGDTAVIYFKVSNSVDIGGLQFVLSPLQADNISFIRATAIGRATGWTISSNDTATAQIFLVYSASGSTISSGADSIIMLMYQISSAAHNQIIELQLSEIIISDTNLHAITNYSVRNGKMVVTETAPENILPIASFIYSPQSGVPPLTVTFEASSSSDSDGFITSYSWDFGDSTKGSGKSLSHVFQNRGEFIVTLTVVDNTGATAFISHTVFLYLQADYRRGDVNKDGKTDIFDLLELLKILTGKVPN